MAKKYLVLVSDQVSREVVVTATSSEEALSKADAGEWMLPKAVEGSGDVVKEEVVHRQAEHVMEEDYDS